MRACTAVWLLIAAALSSCVGAAEPRMATTGIEALATAAAPSTVTAAATVTSPPSSSPVARTSRPPDDGDLLSDVEAGPTGTALAATPPPVQETPTATAMPSPTETVWSVEPHPLQIAVMRQQSYPGSPITFEQTLAPGTNYEQYVVSYQSDGYTIFALMTVPHGSRPATGWPAIVFNHGYIHPSAYRTTERYGAYVDAIARNGYIVLKPDLRGHGNSEGGDNLGPVVYGTPAYTVDVLNAVASLQAYVDADSHRIGMWGHSMGGQLTLRAMVVSPDIRAGVIWAGDVAPYPAVVAAYWGRGNVWTESVSATYGSVDENPEFWASISPNTYLPELSGPMQLHHGDADTGVSVAWSEALAEELGVSATQPWELHLYPGDNHNISNNFGLAMQRTVAFFDQYVGSKGE